MRSEIGKKFLLLKRSPLRQKPLTKSADKSKNVAAKSEKVGAERGKVDSDPIKVVAAKDTEELVKWLRIQINSSPSQKLGIEEEKVVAETGKFAAEKKSTMSQ